MALRWTESFDWVDANQRYANGDSGTTSGRYGGLAWYHPGEGVSYITLPPMDNQSTWIVGCAMRLSAPYTADADAQYYTGAPNGYPIIGFLDNGTLQMHIQTDHRGQLIARQGAVIKGGGGMFLPNRWTYIEVKVFFSAVGFVEVRQDGVLVASAYGFNNGLSSHFYANQIQFANPSVQGVGYTLDDIYVCDGLGGSFNDYLGEIRYDTARPIAPGAHTDFVSSTFGLNWQNVDETTPDNDTSYNSSGTVTAMDTFPIATLATTATPLAVSLNSVATKDTFGGHQIKNVVRQGSTDYVPGVAHTIGSTYNCFSDLLTTQPDGAGGWTVAALNAAQFGVKISA